MTTTILFSDLVNSTELLQRAGDERAQRIFQTHHKLLKEAVAANGGHEVKWLGDGLMVAFPSAADAVRCAIAMQQAARRPTAGECLAIRVGLNVGEALRDETDYFGTPVVVAKRLCDRAQPGQILCSSVVSHLLAGRQAFTFRDLGQIDLKGLSAPTATCEVRYDAGDPSALLTRMPFAGRSAEVTRLQQALAATRAGTGRLVMLAGEPGIGKTRTLEEIAAHARDESGTVLWGRCFEGDWAPPFGPFAEAIANYSRTADADQLRADLSYGAAPLARLVPALRQVLPDIPEPAALQADEERFRLLDAVMQFLIALAARAPVLLVLDDLHWADKGTIAMLRHVARFAPQQRILVLGAYRDVDLDRQHPLADALSALHRETTFDRIPLKGLASNEIGALLAIVADQPVPVELINAISSETDGNPFFIREVLLHLVEEGKIFHELEGWSTTLSIADMGIPESVRQVIGRRLSRLSANTNRLLGVAAACNGGFRFSIVAPVAGLDEAPALDAVDEALHAQVLRPGSEPDTYDFTHAIIRHTLYTELSPSRQVRLHRQIAEMMERVYAQRVAEHAGEIAYQYARSAVLPGAERGVVHALAAADRAEAAYAHDEFVIHLRTALELLPPDDAQRGRVLSRMGIALAWALNPDAALTTIREAGEHLAATEGHIAAADYLGRAAVLLMAAGFSRAASAVAQHGLTYVGTRRDDTWVRLQVFDIIRRETREPDYTGIVIDTPERREVAAAAAPLRAAFTTWEHDFLWITGFLGGHSRREVLDRSIQFPDDPTEATNSAGEFRRCVPLWEAWATRSEREGRITDAALYNAYLSRCHNALGEFDAAQAAYARGRALTARLTLPAVPMINLAAAQEEMQRARGERLEHGIRHIQTLMEQPAVENAWALVLIRAVAAHRYADRGRTDDALQLLALQLAPIERAPGWAPNYTMVVCDAAEVLWRLQRTDHIEIIERSLREKIIAPDFRYPMRDGRHALAQLCALQRRYDEAAEWFAAARCVLDEQGTRPLRAIVDYDEAQMYRRRAAPGDHERAQGLLAAAREQFQALGMTGWVQRTENREPDSCLSDSPTTTNHEHDRRP